MHDLHLELISSQVTAIGLCKSRSKALHPQLSPLQQQCNTAAEWDYAKKESSCS